MPTIVVSLDDTPEYKRIVDFLLRERGLDISLATTVICLTSYYWFFTYLRCQHSLLTVNITELLLEILTYVSDQKSCELIPLSQLEKGR